jgi:hypothetical protein
VIRELVKQTAGEEQALYVLLAATRMSEALAVETRHFIGGRANHYGRTTAVDQDRAQITAFWTDR